MTYDFYVNCIDDIAATSEMKWGLRDAEAAEEFNSMRKTHKNYHAGKEAILRVLSKMEVDFLTARDDIRENVANGKDVVARKRAAMDQANQQRESHCAEERRQRGPLAAIVSSHDKAIGAKTFEEGVWAKNYKKWLNDLDRIRRERALIKEMQKLLAKLINVKSTSELELNQNDLAKSPELKSTFEELIQRAHKGHTDVVERLLIDLLKKLQAEEDETHKSIENQKTTLARQTKLESDLRAQRKTLQAKFDAQQARCVNARKDAKVKYATYTAANAVVVKDIATATKALDELEKEVEMVKSLRGTVTDWSKNKNFKKCRAPTALLQEGSSVSKKELYAREDAFADTLEVGNGEEEDEDIEADAAAKPDAAAAEDEDDVDAEEDEDTSVSGDAAARADDASESDDGEDDLAEFM